MSLEKNLSINASLLDKNQELKRDLDAALATIARYESLLAELRSENSSNLKKITHDMAGPLQILSMTIESLQDRAPEFGSTLDRMKRSTDHMIEIINTLRKLQKTQIATLEKDIKVV